MKTRRPCERQPATISVSWAEMGQRQRQSRQGTWSCNVASVPAVFLLFLAMAPVQSLHFPSFPMRQRMDLMEVNMTASVSGAWRTGYHFQPRKNWMNDPNGPMFYKGYYHLFYQYNPYYALWGNITWGHAVSTDLIHWMYLDDQAVKGGPYWYDIRGAWSGSTTFMMDGTPVMMYTGWANTSDTFQIQTQNLVVPDDPSDPLLRVWWKSTRNPLIVANLNQNASNFRDPVEGWHGPDGNWRTLIGSRQEDFAGTAFVYSSPDFLNWTYLHQLHTVPGTGMWECPDLFPVSLTGEQGLPVSNTTGNLKHVLKASLDKYKKDAYAIGTYDPVTDTFTATNPALDVGIGRLYDYGKFYASKSFFDQKKGRRILWGWINESTSDQNAIITGWSGLQGIPREVYLDPQSDTSLIQLPVAELDSLHMKNVTMTNMTLNPGAVVNITGVSGPQLDIQVQFLKPEQVEPITAINDSFIATTTAQTLCSGSAAADMRGMYGPFGLLVLADKDFEEQTAIYFYLISANSSSNGTWQALLCSDQSKSSLQIGTDETTYGTYVPVAVTDKYLELRTLVDHSIVESFAQGGRGVITTRVYPFKAINTAANAYLFNNGTTAIQVNSLTAWEMANIRIDQFVNVPSPVASPTP